MNGLPKGRDPEIPYCPICGERCDEIYKDKDNWVFGCDICISRVDAWDEESCFPDKEEI